jgi:two-component system NtrC family sensor kinase
MRTRIGVRIILGTALVLALTIGAMAFLIVRAHRAELVGELTQSADHLNETIKSSMHDDMLENRRDRLHRQIEILGRQPGIEKVRVFNKEGRVMLSSDPAEIGHSLDKRAEGCHVCHAGKTARLSAEVAARARIVEHPDGGRVLGIISPIPNEPSCWTAACHVHRRGEMVLGVLDVNVSLARVDRTITRSRNRMVVLAALAMAASSLFLWWLNRRLVLSPVAALASATRRVAEGDLTTTVPVRSGHELGDLARAFNDMIRRIAETQRQLTQADKLASVGRLAAGVAHEINNPLTGVLTYASFLHGRAKDKPELAADLEVIVRETKRCREIVRGLLDFARQLPPKLQPADLNDVARRAVAIVMNQLSLSRVSLDLQLDPDLPAVQADDNQLQQVIVNLMLNAADALGEEGGAIRLATRRAALSPWGHAPIRAATCPKGCDLIDPSVHIGGLAAIHVTRTCHGRSSPLHLDPVYGRFQHVAAEACEEGLLAAVACPRCRASLVDEARRCAACGAPVVSIRGPGGEEILWCARIGCHGSRWEAREAAGARPVVEVTVEDSGRGIPAADLPKLFEPFFTTKGSRGTGLGLAVTWGIVERHGGTIDVASEEGKGSRFTVHLPLDAGEAQAAPRQESAHAAIVGRPGRG